MKLSQILEPYIKCYTPLTFINQSLLGSMQYLAPNACILCVHTYTRFPGFDKDKDKTCIAMQILTLIPMTWDSLFNMQALSPVSNLVSDTYS